MGPLKASFDVGPPPSSEDCLLLDVLTSIQPASDMLPVMVQMHSGGASSYDGHVAVGVGSKNSRS